MTRQRRDAGNLRLCDLRNLWHLRLCYLWRVSLRLCDLWHLRRVSLRLLLRNTGNLRRTGRADRHGGSTNRDDRSRGIAECLFGRDTAENTLTMAEKAHDVRVQVNARCAIFLAVRLRRQVNVDVSTAIDFLRVDFLVVRNTGNNTPMRRLDREHRGKRENPTTRRIRIHDAFVVRFVAVLDLKREVTTRKARLVFIRDPLMNALFVRVTGNGHLKQRTQKFVYAGGVLGDGKAELERAFPFFVGVPVIVLRGALGCRTPNNAATGCDGAELIGHFVFLLLTAELCHVITTSGNIAGIARLLAFARMGIEFTRATKALCNATLPGVHTGELRQEIATGRKRSENSRDGIPHEIRSKHFTCPFYP
ncbi:hypothetical protein Ab1vBOLIVR4_gp23 [Agrobacterium phage OLIVR4]|nr:hypothetical protein Ab1vBOLIVR4_gp23 [Agrobacterium phage OLIVR4]